ISRATRSQVRVENTPRPEWVMTNRYSPVGSKPTATTPPMCRYRSIGASPSPNATVHPPGPLQRRGVARNKNAAPVGVQRLVRRFVGGSPPQVELLGTLLGCRQPAT